MKKFAIIYLLLTEITLAKPRLWVDREPGFFGNIYLVKDSGEKIEFYDSPTMEMEKLMQDNELALITLKNANSFRSSAAIWFWSTYPLGIGAMIATPFVGAQNSYAGGACFVGGLTLVVIGAIFSIQKDAAAKYHAIRAINIYNGVKYDEKLGVQFRDSRYSQTEISYSYRF